MHFLIVASGHRLPGGLRVGGSLQRCGLGAKLGSERQVAAFVTCEVEMAAVRKSVEVLEQEFLPIRAKILEVASALDRLDRASGSVASDAQGAGSGGHSDSAAARG